jgi:hydrogenase 3 maturation protease
MGIGNRLRGDDGAGPELIAKLQEKWDSQGYPLDSDAQTFFLDAGESPEDWFIRILDLTPEVIVVVDAVDLKVKAGSIAILEPSALPESSCFSTHRLPLRDLLTLWNQKSHVLVVLAIQPESLEFFQEISPSVRKAIDNLVELLL